MKTIRELYEAIRVSQTTPEREAATQTLRNRVRAEARAEVSRLQNQAAVNAGMAKAAYGHGSALMGESYQQTGREQLEKARGLRRLMSRLV